MVADKFFVQWHQIMNPCSDCSVAGHPKPGACFLQKPRYNFRTDAYFFHVGREIQVAAIFLKFFASDFSNPDFLAADNKNFLTRGGNHREPYFAISAPCLSLSPDEFCSFEADGVGFSAWGLGPMVKGPSPGPPVGAARYSSASSTSRLLDPQIALRTAPYPRIK